MSLRFAADVLDRTIDLTESQVRALAGVVDIDILAASSITEILL
jgi:hypothetical protein